MSKVGKADIEAVMGFYHHFSVPISKELNKALNDATTSGFSQESLDTLRMELAKDMANNPHPIFKDKLFADVVKECIEMVSGEEQ